MSETQDNAGIPKVVQSARAAILDNRRDWRSLLEGFQPTLTSIHPVVPENKIFIISNVSTNKKPWHPSCIQGKVTGHKFGRRLPQEVSHTSFEVWKVNGHQMPSNGKNLHKPLAIVS